MKQKKNANVLRALIVTCLLFILAAAMLLTYLHFKPEGKKGAKKITVSVVIPDQKTKEFTLQTDAAYLSQALEEKDGLIKGKKGPYGLFITDVNGRTADDSKKEWWCITKDGQTVNTGVDMTPISDGEKYEITLQTGY